MSYPLSFDLAVDNGGLTTTVVTSAASAQSQVIPTGIALVTVTALTFVRQGLNPTAVATTDIPLAPNVPYRISMAPGNRLAFIGSAGSAYVTPLNV